MMRAAFQMNMTLQQMITTPLMLMIILLTYRDQEAMEILQYSSPTDQQQRIFRQYIQHMLSRHHSRRIFSTRRLLTSLQWLAQTMQNQHLTEFYLERFQPTWLATGQAQAVYRLFYGLFIGLLTGSFVGGIAGLSLGLFAGLSLGLFISLLTGLILGLDFGPLIGLFSGLILGLLAGLIFPWLALLLNGGNPYGGNSFGFYAFGGLFFGLLSGLLAKRNPNNLTEKVVWSWQGCRKGVLFGVIGGSILGGAILPGEINFNGNLGTRFVLTDVLLFGLGPGLIFGLIFGLFEGLSGIPLKPDLHRRPNQGIRSSGWNAVRFSFVLLLAFGLLTWLIAGLVIWLAAYQMADVGFLAEFQSALNDAFYYGHNSFVPAVGVFGGVFGGMFSGGDVYLRHYLCRLIITRNRMFPWRAIPLLEEATNCILLQRVGGGYRFIHPLLQEHFARLDVEATLEQGTLQTRSPM